MSESIFKEGDVAEYVPTGTMFTFVTGPNEHGDTVWQDANDNYHVFGILTEWRRIEVPPKDSTIYISLYKGEIDGDIYDSEQEARYDYDYYTKNDLEYKIGQYEFVGYLI